MEILTFSCSLYQYVGHRYIKILMHCWFYKFRTLFFLRAPSYVFRKQKRIISQTCRISSALVFLCTCGLHTDVKSMKKSRSPWKMVKIYTKFGQNIHKLDTFDGFSRRSKLFLSLNCPKCNEEHFKGKKSHDLLKKNLKMVNYEQYCGGHMRKSTKKDTRNPRITHRLGI